MYLGCPFAPNRIRFDFSCETLSNTSHLIERFAQFRCCLLTGNKKAGKSMAWHKKWKKTRSEENVNVKQLDLSTHIGITRFEYKLSVSRSSSACSHPHIRISAFSSCASLHLFVSVSRLTVIGHWFAYAERFGYLNSNRLRAARF